LFLRNIANSGIFNRRRNGVSGRQHHTDVFVSEACLIQGRNYLGQGDIAGIHSVGGRSSGAHGLISKPVAEEG
jgi:hypothetical protein